MSSLNELGVHGMMRMILHLGERSHVAGKFQPSVADPG